MKTQSHLILTSDRTVNVFLWDNTEPKHLLFKDEKVMADAWKPQLIILTSSEEIKNPSREDLSKGLLYSDGTNKIITTELIRGLGSYYKIVASSSKELTPNACIPEFLIKEIIEYYNLDRFDGYNGITTSEHAKWKHVMPSIELETHNMPYYETLEDEEAGKEPKWRPELKTTSDNYVIGKIVEDKVLDNTKISMAYVERQKRATTKEEMDSMLKHYTEIPLSSLSLADLIALELLFKRENHKDGERHNKVIDEIAKRISQINFDK